MKKTTYQVPEIRDENDNIVQEGTFGKKSAFVDSTNQGAFDYLLNNLEALHDIATGAYLVFDSKDKFPSAGDTEKIYVSNADGKAYRWNGTEYVYMGTESTQFTALDVKKMKEAAADSATSAASSAADAGASASSASASATDAEASRQAAASSAADARASASSASTSAADAEASRQAAEQSNTTILNQYVLTSLRGVNDVTKYNQVRNFYLTVRGVDKLSGTTVDDDATTLTGIITDWYKLTRKLVEDWDGWVEFYHPDVASLSTGTRKGSLDGMTCTPSTNDIHNTDDFEGNPLFAITYCNWKIVNKEPVITAIKGVSKDFSQYNKSRYVGVLQMSAYHHWTTKEESSSHYDDGLCAVFNATYSHIKPLPESVKMDGTMREWVIHGCYPAGSNTDGSLTCCSGAPLITKTSYVTQLTACLVNGAGYSGFTGTDWAFIKLMVRLKYASLTLDGIMEGFNPFGSFYTTKCQVAETGVKRVILSASDYMVNYMKVGGTLLIGSLGGIPFENDADISGNDGLIITSVDDITINGTAYKAVYVDTDSTFDTTTDTEVAPGIWRSGSCDKVKGNDGMPTSERGKAPFKIQGIEIEHGCAQVLGDTVLKSSKNSDGTYTNEILSVKDATLNASTVNDNFISTGIKAIVPATGDWLGIKYEEYSSGIYWGTLYGSDSGTYTKDAGWPPRTEGTFEILAMGRIYNNFWGCGLSRFFALNGLSGVYAHYGSRLSPNGCRGVWGASPQA